MSGRERIILGIMALALLYGAYEFLFAKAKTADAPASPEAQQSDLMAFTRTVAEGLGKSAYTEADAYAISQAAAPWLKDPFLRSVMRVRPEPDTASDATREQQLESPAVSFRYTGYLGLGNVRMAIINGSEYREGDSLEPEGYYVKSIGPRQVAIGVRGKEKSILLQLEEPNLTPTKTTG